LTNATIDDNQLDLPGFPTQAGPGQTIGGKTGVTIEISSYTDYTDYTIIDGNGEYAGPFIS